MYTFWKNILKFPPFFISALLGFVLITFNTIIRLINNPKKKLIVIVAISFSYLSLVRVLKLMLALN